MKIHTSASAIADGIETKEFADNLIRNNEFLIKADTKVLLHLICTQNNAILNLLTSLVAMLEEATSNESKTIEITRRLDSISSSLAELTKK